ncbi:MAG: hypothetical protein A4E48_01257 [Methanosaeta sp. PtaU1.Bin060]|nr:MAG: hypothetical protein A4E48_01257 [Methanosaeta sp. PtaU1.Bin060]
MTDLWDLMADETRESFSELKNLMMGLDTKASIIIVINGVLLAALSLIQSEFVHLGIIYRILILLPLFLSVGSAIGCLYPRRWSWLGGQEIIDKYQCEDNADLVACQISKTRAGEEDKLRKLYDEKFDWFECSFWFMAVTLIFVGILFIYLLLDP